ncbi:MAG TPA: holo-ACP synthase [Pyrinomonadaceae bacterium]|nr:holo-ACP synthase [Pyrinomonadaceae bacterium]
MIVAIGIDIIEVARIREVLSRTPGFRLRVFTEAEREYCDSRGLANAQHYAARFAAKEAALKALHTGWRGGIGWQDVEVAAHDSGAPYLVLHAKVKELFDASNATKAHLTMSHTSEHAIAEVILERA